jgi:hypothetical protein
MSTVNDLDRFLKNYKLFPALIRIAHFSNRLFLDNNVFADFPLTINGRTYKQTVTQWGLFFIAHRLILSSNDGRSSNFEHQDLFQANQIFNDLNEPFLQDSDLFGLMGRVSYEQFWWQDCYTYNFSRNYIILVELHDKFKDVIKVDLDKVFYENFNLTIKDFLIIAFIIFGQSQINPCFTLEDLYDIQIPELDVVLKVEKINSFIKLVSASYSQIRELSFESNRRILPVELPDFERYAFNPLLTYPLVKCHLGYKQSRNSFVVTNSVVFLKKFMDGVYWLLRDLYNESNSEYFLQSFGDLFEIYVGEILKRYFGEHEVINLNDYLKLKPKSKNQPKIADWLIDIGDSILIFECKSQLIPMKLKQTFNKKFWNDWSIKVVKKAAEQLDSTLQLLQKDPDYKEKKFFKFIVLNEDLYLAENRIFKENSDFYIITIQELELLEAPIKKFGIHRIMAEKQDIDKRNRLEEGQNFIHVYKSIGDVELTNNWLQETYDKFFDEFKL